MPLPTDLAEAHALIRRQSEEPARAAARASGAEALIAHMKLVIAKLRREQYGQSSERGRKVLDQLELQLEEPGSRDQRERSHSRGQGGRRRRGELGPPAAGTRTLTGPPAARAGHYSSSLRVSGLRRQAGQARRRYHRDSGNRSAPMEGDPDGTGEVHLPVLREDHPATGALPCHCPRPCVSQPTVISDLCQMQHYPAALTE